MVGLCWFKGNPMEIWRVTLFQESPMKVLTDGQCSQGSGSRFWEMLGFFGMNKLSHTNGSQIGVTITSVLSNVVKPLDNCMNICADAGSFFCGRCFHVAARRDRTYHFLSAHGLVAGQGSSCWMLGFASSS